LSLKKYYDHWQAKTNLIVSFFMAHPKRSKSTGKASQKHVQAKQAVKKKQKGAVKFRNEELRTLLDSQASTLYAVRSSHTRFRTLF
jgi:hypothetical protein